MTPVDYTVKSLKEGSIRFAAEQPENGKNHPRNLFIWRSNLLGSSGKGHEYMLKYLLGTENGIQGKDTGKQGGVKPEEVEWRDNGLDGKLDLVVTLDFRLSSTCLYSDIVLPTATWYEKDDMNTSDMHPFIHPLSAAVDPARESKSDWEIHKGIAKKFSEVCVGHLGKETDVVTLPIQHDSAAEMAQPLDVKDWKKANAISSPGKPRRILFRLSVITRRPTSVSPRSARCWKPSATAGKASPGTPRARWICCVSSTTPRRKAWRKASRSWKRPSTPRK